MFKQVVAVVFICLVTSLVFTGCSSKSINATDSVKSQFEESFTQQCVEKEIANSINKDVDRVRFAKPCACISKRIMGNLSEVEARKFLQEKKITQSLRINFDKAAFFCIQTKATPKVLFAR